jgi:hypothetical protein
VKAPRFPEGGLKRVLLMVKVWIVILKIIKIYSESKVT